MIDLYLYLTPEVKENIKQAINDDRINWLERDGLVIGFHTWEDYGDRIFINNLWVKKEYRDKDNLLFLRKKLRKRFPNRLFYWENRKSKKERQYD